MRKTKRTLIALSMIALASGGGGAAMADGTHRVFRYGGWWDVPNEGAAHSASAVPSDLFMRHGDVVEFVEPESWRRLGNDMEAWRFRALKPEFPGPQPVQVVEEHEGKIIESTYVMMTFECHDHFVNTETVQLKSDGWHFGSSIQHRAEPNSRAWLIEKMVCKRSSTDDGIFVRRGELFELVHPESWGRVETDTGAIWRFRKRDLGPRKSQLVDLIEEREAQVIPGTIYAMVFFCQDHVFSTGPGRPQYAYPHSMAGVIEAEVCPHA